MKTTAAALTIGAAHVLYTYFAYKGHLFGLGLPYGLAISLWLVIPCLLAGYGYWRVSALIPGVISRYGIRAMYVLACLFSSLYLGAFMALNAFGS